MKTIIDLNKKIEEILNGEINFNEFESAFMSWYLEIEDDALTALDNDFMEDINDRLAYAAQDPDDQDRKYGFIDQDEFKIWLKQKYLDYQNNR